MATQAVPDRLKFDIKATAVDGSNTMKTTPADGSDYYRGEVGSTVRFVVPHSTFSDFCDPTMSRFRFQIQVLVPNNLIPYDNSISLKVKGEAFYSKEVVFFDRGIESIIQRVQIFDTSGNLLESIDHYNALYAITELCTGKPDVRKGQGRFTMECMTINDYGRGSAVWPEPQPQTVTLGEVWQN